MGAPLTHRASEKPQADAAEAVHGGVLYAAGGLEGLERGVGKAPPAAASSSKGASGTSTDCIPF